MSALSARRLFLVNARDGVCDIGGLLGVGTGHRDDEKIGVSRLSWMPVHHSQACHKRSLLRPGRAGPRTIFSPGRAARSPDRGFPCFEASSIDWQQNEDRHFPRCFPAWPWTLMGLASDLTSMVTWEVYFFSRKWVVMNAVTTTSRNVRVMMPQRFFTTRQ